MKELIVDVRDKIWNDIEEDTLNRIDYINDNYEEVVSNKKQGAGDAR